MKTYISRYLFPLIALIFLANVPKATAQSEAFETLSAGVFVGTAVAGGELLDKWNSKPGLQFSLQTPFYAGELETGIRYTQFTNAPGFPDYSDFQTTFFYLGWGYDFAVTDKFRVGPILRFGTTFFKYDEPKRYTRPEAGWAYEFDIKESEFAYDLIVQSEYRFTKNFSISAEYTYNRTLTYYPIQLNYVTAGITYTFNTPGWLKKGLK